MLKPVPISSAEHEPPHPGVYQPAGSNNRDDVLIDEKLTDVVALHFARLLSPALRARNPVRTLFIVGWPGDGKTFSLLVACSRLLVDVVLTAGADYAGEYEGAPVAMLKAAHTWMRWKSAETKRPIALLIDDIDASTAAENADQERTGNTNLLVGKLQSICNSPDQFTDASGNPIPLLWTGNATSHFRGSLIRHGRVRIHHHDLNWHTKADMVERIFKPATPVDRRALRNLVYRYRHKPIAFFNDLNAELADEAIAQIIKREGLNITAIEAMAARSHHLDMRQLFAAAHARAESGGDFSSQRSAADVR
jgi:hypothetical protein